MKYKLFEEKSEIEFFESMNSVDSKIEEICKKDINYKSHNSIHSLNQVSDREASYLIHTKIVLTDGSFRTMTHNLIIDKLI